MTSRRSNLPSYESAINLSDISRFEYDSYEACLPRYTPRAPVDTNSRTSSIAREPAVSMSRSQRPTRTRSSISSSSAGSNSASSTTRNSRVVSSSASHTAAGSSPNITPTSVPSISPAGPLPRTRLPVSISLGIPIVLTTQPVSPTPVADPPSTSLAHPANGPSLASSTILAAGLVPATSADQTTAMADAQPVKSCTRHGWFSASGFKYTLPSTIYTIHISLQLTYVLYFHFTKVEPWFSTSTPWSIFYSYLIKVLFIEGAIALIWQKLIIEVELRCCDGEAWRFFNEIVRACWSVGLLLVEAILIIILTAAR